MEKTRLAAVDLVRLTKLCGLFSSAHAGERASAAAKADAFLRQHGCRWGDVLSLPTLAPPPPPPPPDPPPVPAWQQTAAACRAHADRMSAWEVAFVTKIATYAHSPTQRQLDCLAAILARVLA